MARCTATTKKGTRCKRNADFGKSYCHSHFTPDDEPNRQVRAVAPPQEDGCLVQLIGLALCGLILFGVTQCVENNDRNQRELKTQNKYEKSAEECRSVVGRAVKLHGDDLVKGYKAGEVALERCMTGS
jgi:hypothetical protein